MSRAAPKPRPSENPPSDDICPVCKSNRYLNPSLQFLINPECYHKMCSTCVDRIFTSGPQTCPVPYCLRTLRKKGFHKAYFADLAIEREVDIRRRVGAVFNRRADEFESRRHWDDYLEEVEELVFDIVNGSKEEKAKAEDRLERYKAQNVADIEDNRRAGIEEREFEARREKAEKEAMRQRRILERREDAEEKLDVAKSKMDILDRLASSKGDARKITQQAQRVVLKKSSARRAATESFTDNTTSGLDSLSLRGLKKKGAPVVEKPYDSFGGLDLTPTRYVLQNDYESEWLVGAKTDPRHTAGGFSLHEYYTRTMFEAFSGLGVFIEDEVATKGKPSKQALSKGLGGVAAAQAAVDDGGARVEKEVEVKTEMDVDDVF